jgi:hypothetical protein
VANRRAEREPATGIGWMFGLVNVALDLVPGARMIQRTIATIERQVLRELRERLDRLDVNEEPSAAPEADGAGPQTPAAILAELLDRSMEQSPEEARRSAFVGILRQMTPDEARILAALSDGGGHPVIHVTAASALGSREQPILSNVSSIGQAAGVQLREMTPHYISHLRELGLVELAPEDPALAIKCEILESNTEVRDAVAQVERRQRMARARIIRKTLRATRLGRELWVACQSESGR